MPVGNTGAHPYRGFAFLHFLRTLSFHRLAFSGLSCSFFWGGQPPLPSSSLSHPFSPHFPLLLRLLFGLGWVGRWKHQELIIPVLLGRREEIEMARIAGEAGREGGGEEGREKKKVVLIFFVAPPLLTSKHFVLYQICISKVFKGHPTPHPLKVVVLEGGATYLLVESRLQERRRKVISVGGGAVSKSFGH